MNLDLLLRYHFRDRDPQLVFGKDYRIVAGVDGNGVQTEPEIRDWKPGEAPPTIAQLRANETAAIAWENARLARNQLIAMNMDIVIDAIVREIKAAHPQADFTDVQDILDLRADILAGGKPLKDDPRERRARPKRGRS